MKFSTQILAAGLILGGFCYGQSGKTVGLTWQDNNLLGPGQTATYTVYEAQKSCTDPALSFTVLQAGVTLKTFSHANVPYGIHCYAITVTIASTESPKSMPASAIATPNAPTLAPPTIASLLAARPWVLTSDVTMIEVEVLRPALAGET